VMLLDEQTTPICGAGHMSSREQRVASDLDAPEQMQVHG